MVLEVQGSHHGVGNFLTGWIVVRNQSRLDGETGVGRCLPDIVEHEVKRAQGATGPGFADFAKETMLYRIPFGGTGRIMTDGDDQTETIRHLFLQPILPQPTASTIAATTISFNEQRMGIGEAQRQFSFAPAGDVIDSKGRGVGGLTDIDGSAVVTQVIDTIRNGAPSGLGGEVMDIDHFSASPPSAPTILEIADQFFLFRVHAQTRLPYRQMMLALRQDMLELFIPLRMRFALIALLR
jgi:hypothetical protein